MPTKRSARQRVIAQLRLHGGLARAELVTRTGLSRATVAAVLRELLDEGLVVEREGRDPTRRAHSLGRPPSVVALHRVAGAAGAIDFGKRHIRVGLSDLSHARLADCVEKVPEDLPADAAFDIADGLLDAALAGADLCRADLIGLGIAVPGPLHAPTGRLGSATILPGWSGIAAAEVAKERFGLPVRIDNDANLGALAELLWGAGRGVSDFAYVKLATGIGCGLVLRGEIYRGAGGTAGELGHIAVDPHGRVCRCGNRGCLETVAGADAVAAALNSTDGEHDVADIVARATNGDVACTRVLADTAAVIGGALATVVNLFNPQRVVIGGALAAAGALLLDPLRSTIERAAVPSAVADLEVVRAELDERAEVAGAIALVLRDPTLTLPEARAS